jgi:hypothetical protein
METRIARQGWIILLGVPALFLCAYIIAAFPAITNLPLCAVKSFVGIDCPGCGLTRSIAFLTHGEIRKSIDLHPMGIVVALILIYLFARTLTVFIIGKEIRPFTSQKARDTLLMIFLAALLGQWLVKLFFSFHF